MVLVADDNADVRAAFAHALRESGFAVRTARDAYEARRLMRGVWPDLVLSDIRMPGDGMTLLRDVRSLRPETPVIVMTAFEQPGDRRRALAAGAADFLVKPVGWERLRSALASALRRR